MHYSPKLHHKIPIPKIDNNKKRKELNSKKANYLCLKEERKYEKRNNTLN